MSNFIFQCYFPFVLLNHYKLFSLYLIYLFNVSPSLSLFFFFFFCELSPYKTLPYKLGFQNSVYVLPNKQESFLIKNLPLLFSNIYIYILIYYLFSTECSMWDPSSLIRIEPISLQWKCNFAQQSIGSLNQIN